MNNTKKYRIWGIGALVVLVIVIIFAIAMIAGVSKKTPKADANKTKAETSQQETNKDDKNKPATENKEKEKTKEEANADKDKNAEEDTDVKTPVAETKPAQDAENMPSTGPASNLLTIFLIATSAYLLALNANWTKR